MKNYRRLISLFLIAFGLAGYVICIPLAYYSQSVINAASPALDDVSKSMETIRIAVVDAETTLTDFNMSVGAIIVTVTSFNLSYLNDILNVTIVDIGSMLNETQTSLASVEEMLNDADTTIDAVEVMLNQTIITVNSVAVMLNDNADWLELFGNNSAFQLLAPDITTQATAMAVSMRSTAQVLKTLPIRDAVEALQGLPLTPVKTALRSLPLNTVTESLKTMQEALQPFIQQLETAIQEALIMFQLLQNFSGIITPRITEIHTILDTWDATIQTVKSQLSLIQLGIYAIIFYILCLHTAFLAIGVITKNM